MIQFFSALFSPLFCDAVLINVHGPIQADCDGLAVYEHDNTMRPFAFYADGAIFRDIDLIAVDGFE